jgi:hypothetical protein
MSFRKQKSPQPDTLSTEEKLKKTPRARHMPRPSYNKPMRRHLITILLCTCVLLFVTALAGSIYCGKELVNPDLAIERATYQRQLIYFHFGVAQLAIIGTGCILYLRHKRWRRYYLVVSYNEKGLTLDPPGIHTLHIQLRHQLILYRIPYKFS